MKINGRQALIDRFLPAIEAYDGNPLSRELLIAADGPLSVYYAPVEYINPDARLILIGITPGKTQADNSLNAAHASLTKGQSAQEALIQAKQTAAFSGAMRPNLIAMLNRIGLDRWLNLNTCDELFGSNANKLQSTSVLPFPVFLNGENYRGTPDPIKNSFLRKFIIEFFVPGIKALPGAVYVPLGPVPTMVMAWLISEGHLEPGRILSGLPHPSGANAERIAYFLGNKPRSLLSSKTDHRKLDSALDRLRESVKAL